MTFPYRQKRQPQPPRPTPEWLAYLRLKGIADGSARTNRCVALRVIRADCAVGLFHVGSGRGWYVMAAFRGESHWRELALTVEEGMDDYRERVSKLLRFVDPSSTTYDPSIQS